MIYKKKIILFIVEGVNDKTNLALCLDQVLSSNTVLFKITDGDITTKYGNSSSNIVARIGNIVKDFSGKVFKKEDFQEIVHLIDMDGAYIPDERVVEGNIEKTYYSEEFIKTSNVKMIIDRNHQKQEVLDKMTQISKVWKSISYSVYYYSCNMDHVLHKDANLSREEKDKLAVKFENKYFNKPQEFIKFFHSNEFAVQGTYGETWEFIKVGTNSLKRYSNFNLYLDTVANGG